jgi:PadR family transcriptional regulator AphA
MCHDEGMILARLILGLLNLAPMTGYDLKKHFDSSVNHFWHADRAQIYRTLAQLVRDGLAVVRTVPQENYPDRQEHHITEAGRRELEAWLGSPLGPDPVREPFLARVFFAGDMERTKVLELLELRRAQAQAQLAEFEAMHADLGDAAIRDRRAYLMAATLDGGIRHVRAEIEWLDSTKENLP